MEKWFGLLIQKSIHKMNNPIVKLDLDSIIKCWFRLWTKIIYLFFILVCCVQSYLLPFSYRLWLRFSLPLIKMTARIDRLQMQRNWQGLRIEIQQSPHIHWPLFDHRVFLEVISLLHWLLAAKWHSCDSLFGFEFQKKKQNSEAYLWKV